MHYGAGYLFVFKAWQQAHSGLCNCCCNEEDGQKDKPECTSYKIPIAKVVLLLAIDLYTHLSSIFGSGMPVKGRCESVSHMDVVNADIAGANICPWKLDDSIHAVNTYAKHPTAKYPSAKIPSVMGISHRVS